MNVTGGATDRQLDTSRLALLAVDDERTRSEESSADIYGFLSTVRVSVVMPALAGKMRASRTGSMFSTLRFGLARGPLSLLRLGPTSDDKDARRLLCCAASWRSWRASLPGLIRRHRSAGALDVGPPRLATLGPMKVNADGLDVGLP